MGYDLIPINKGIYSKSGMIFTWPTILEETGAGYLFNYGKILLIQVNIYMMVLVMMEVR